MNNKINPIVLVIGDMIAIALFTLIGFATHGEMELSYLPRMGASFFPVLIGWFLLAPWFGLFNDEAAEYKKILWRVPLAMLFAAPLATVLRAVVLHSAVIPLFALILGSTNAFGLLAWRLVYGRILGK